MNLKKLRLRSTKINSKMYKKYIHCIEDLLENEKVNKMDQYPQHYFTTCLEHCLNVSFYSYIICRYIGLDYVSAARGALLHDLFLYDWRTTKLKEGKHAFRHPDIALENAMKIFDLNEIEKDSIKKHMWPLTIKPPKYYESLIVCFMDKYCATVEIVRGVFTNIKYRMKLQ
ncbi:HD domain-containing protein [Garciella nitratireducens]|nr:HD domain-containing protein [Garciella nitratireducens]